MSWTDERVEQLKKMWLEGLSASQIAAELGDGVTRNAVIGKVHRLKLSGRAKPASAPPRARPQARPAPRRLPGSGGRPMGGSTASSVGAAPRRTMPQAPMIGATALKIDAEYEVEALVAAPVTELFIPVDQRIGLLGLSEHTCKWPIGDPLSKDFYFCGQHSEEGKPYCDFHSRRAYHQVDRKKR